MARLNLPPTKSSLLALQHQLEFAQEGYDLLDQKRQILIYELMHRIDRAVEVRQRLEAALRQAHGTLREALFEVGSDGLNRAALGVWMDHRIEWVPQSMMGLGLPSVEAHVEPFGLHFGLGGTSAHCDRALQQFTALLPLLAELATLENAAIRLARELSKTQRRCNALSKVLIPAYQDTIGYIAGSLEERERESFVILKMIRDRLRES